MLPRIQAPATNTPDDSSAAPAMQLARIYLNAATGRYEFWNSAGAGTEAFIVNNGSTGRSNLDSAPANKRLIHVVSPTEVSV